MKIKSLLIKKKLSVYNKLCHLNDIEQEKPSDGCICRKCWLKVETFHLFYVRIEQIQGVCYKIGSVEEMKYDLPPSTVGPDPNIIYDESRIPESGAEDDFDDILVDNFSDGNLMTKSEPLKIVYTVF